MMLFNFFNLKNLDISEKSRTFAATKESDNVKTSNKLLTLTTK